MTQMSLVKYAVTLFTLILYNVYDIINSIVREFINGKLVEYRLLILKTVWLWKCKEDQKFSVAWWGADVYTFIL